MEILTVEMVHLGSRAVNKEDAIRQAGEVPVNTGCAAASYIEGMLSESMLFLHTLVEMLQEPETTQELVQTKNPSVIVERLTRRRSETR